MGMKDKIFTILFLIIIVLFFSIFIYGYKNKYEVIDVISANRIVADLNHNGIKDEGETICINSVESFNPDDDTFYKKYSSQYKLSKIDIINLWYLGREFGQKAILNKKVSLKSYNSEDFKCKYGEVYVDGVRYSDLVYNSGFGFKQGKIGDIDKFKNNLDTSKKLDLVILNHHSNIYHKLDCEYGKIAHDTIIIPRKQLPNGMRPCNFCHNINGKKSYKFKSGNITPTKTIPVLKLFSGNIALYKFDYTKNLKPNSYCNTEVCNMIVNSINDTKSSIDIAIYGYEDIPAITQALKRAKSRGVKIRFIYDESNDSAKTFYKSNDLIKNIASESMSDSKSSESSKLMHNKFFIFDNKKVITGSMNYSKSGLSGYDVNDVIVINSVKIAELYKAEFDQMLSGKFHTLKSKHNFQNKFIIDNSELEIYFSPQYKSSYRIIQLINGAKYYIYIPTFLITHKALTEALINAKKRNVEVKIIIDANSVNTRNTKHQYLRDSGVALKAENYAGKLHSKTMIIDDEYIIMGSMNFSNSGENKNDENMLVIKNPLLAKNYKEFFMYLWNIIPDKYLKYSPRAESFDSIGSCIDGVDNNFDGKIDSDDDGCKIKK